VIDGLCAAGTRWIFEVEAGSRSDEINVLARGAYYGWPTPRGARTAPMTTLPDAARNPGGCAVLNGQLWVTSLDGEALLSTQLRPGVLSPTTSAFSSVLRHRYGRLRTVVAAPDGALWLTTSNRDGSGDPVATDERVIRYLPGSSGGHSNL
jgi:glucose/arabinose dehydrogenase